MFGKLKRKRARVAIAEQANQMEVLEDRRLMTVSNVQVSAPTSVDEGSTFLLEFSAETDGALTHWTIDVGDGPITVGADTRSLWVGFEDGDMTRNITVTAHDERWNGSEMVYDNESGGTSVNVRNVAPSFTVNAQEEAFVGKPFWLSVTDFFEPGADTLSQWEVDWGDGTVETYDPAVGSFVHTYDHELTPQVTLTAIDEDGRHALAPIVPPVVYEHDITIDNMTTLPGGGGMLELHVRRRAGGHPQSNLSVTLTIPPNMQGKVCFEVVNNTPIYTKTVPILAGNGDQMVNIVRVPNAQNAAGAVTVNATGTPETSTSLRPGSGTITVVSQ